MAAGAFNRMQARIKRLLDGPDADAGGRLPRPEDADHPAAGCAPSSSPTRTCAGRSRADLDEMEAMIQSTLDFLRGDATGEEVRTVDIATILETVCDHLVDAGHDVVLLEACYAPLPCRPLALKRAFGNLVENALKYGHRARVSLARHADGVRRHHRRRRPRHSARRSSSGCSTPSTGWRAAAAARPAAPAWA